MDDTSASRRTGDIARRDQDYKRANTELQAQIGAIVGRLDAVGRSFSAVDDQAVTTANAVLADLETLRARAEELEQQRPYVINVPGGGGVTTDAALIGLERGVSRVQTVLTQHTMMRAGRERAQRQMAARAAVEEIRTQIADLTAEARALHARYAATTPDSAEGLTTRIRAYELMRHLADLEDAANTHRVSAGDMPAHVAQSRREHSDDQRRTADRALTDLRKQQASLG